MRLIANYEQYKLEVFDKNQWLYFRWASFIAYELYALYNFLTDFDYFGHGIIQLKALRFEA